MHMTSVEHEPSRPVTVTVIDDHDVVHAGVEAWCAQADPPIEVVGRYESPTDYRARPVDAAEADVLLLDLQFVGNRPEFALLKELADAGRTVIVYSHMLSDEVILDCLDRGAVTYLTKNEGRNHLVAAIHAAQSGQPYVGPRMAKALLADETFGRTGLTDREKEVLTAWFQTENKDLVAKRLFISAATVRTHLQRARAKYAAVGRPASTKSALLARAIEDGLLSAADI